MHAGSWQVTSMQVQDGHIPPLQGPLITQQDAQALGSCQCSPQVSCRRRTTQCRTQKSGGSEDSFRCPRNESQRASSNRDDINVRSLCLLMEGGSTLQGAYLRLDWSRFHAPTGAWLCVRWPAAPPDPHLPTKSASRPFPQLLVSTPIFSHKGQMHNVLLCTVPAQQGGKGCLRKSDVTTMAALRKPPVALSGVLCQGKGQ